MGIHVVGRRLDPCSITKQYFVLEDRVAIILGDQKDDSWWMEVLIDKDTLQYMLDKIKQQSC